VRGSLQLRMSSYICSNEYYYTILVELLVFNEEEPAMLFWLEKQLILCISDRGFLRFNNN